MTNLAIENTMRTALLHIKLIDTAV